MARRSLRPLCEARSRWCLGYLCVLGAFALGCRAATEPSFPSEAVEITPPARYARWWTLVQACSGRTRPFNSVRWFLAPDSAMHFDGQAYAGFWYPTGNRILLESSSVNDGGVVRHEMLHSLLNDGLHPRADFVDRCGGIVAFGDPLRIEPSELLLGPDPTSPILSPPDLRVSVEISPPAVTHGLPDEGWVTVIVSVTNPLDAPAWVRVRPFYTGQTASQTFGYEVGTTHYGPLTFEDYSRDTLVAFGPGETKRRAFDVYLRGFIGDWWGRGHFNSDTTPTASFTLSP